MGSRSCLGSWWRVLFSDIFWATGSLSGPPCASQTLHYCALVTPLHELIASACFQQADALHQIYFSSFLKFVWKSERRCFFCLFFFKANINRGKTPAVVHWAKPPQRGLNVHLIWRRRFVSRLEFTVNLLCLLFHESDTHTLKKKKIHSTEK